ncbi:MAG TPA: AbrB family transcriptional regulator [Cyanobacteria bacterium UBA8803]|nr:AbrB family transcriptional regulator [Cyanobacteria bacterium UBA9273]HBL59640.1 AbrB family transcriptional regulator [Cyanobacteria bacterium UBA8803]
MPAKTAKNAKNQPLEGEALLLKLQELREKSREEKARACGYYTVTKDGVERVNLMRFLNALMEAQGIELDSQGEVQGTGRGGRTASYRVSVQSNGNLLIGSAYTKKLAVEPGTEFEIVLGKKHIKLTQIEPD